MILRLGLNPQTLLLKPSPRFWHMCPKHVSLKWLQFATTTCSVAGDRREPLADASYNVTDYSVCCGDSGRNR